MEISWWCNLHVDSLHADGDTSPDSSSNDESSSQEVQHIPEVPRAQGTAVEPIDDDSDMEYQDVSTGRDQSIPPSQELKFLDMLYRLCYMHGS